MGLLRPKTSGAEKKKIPVRIPSGLEEASVFVGVIADLERLIKQRVDALSKEIRDLHTATSERVDPMQAEVLALVNGLFLFAEKHRAELTSSGGKTITLPTGTIGWRLTPPAVSIDGVKAVIARIKELGLTKRFLRTKEEVNKEAILEDPKRAEGIEGISIGQQEEFVVKPLTLEREIVKKVPKPRKKKTK